jgi:hypothetical protein
MRKKDDDYTKFVDAFRERLAEAFELPVEILKVERPNAEPEIKQRWESMLESRRKFHESFCEAYFEGIAKDFCEKNGCEIVRLNQRRGPPMLAPVVEDMKMLFRLRSVENYSGQRFCTFKKKREKRKISKKRS